MEEKTVVVVYIRANGKRERQLGENFLKGNKEDRATIKKRERDRNSVTLTANRLRDIRIV